MSLIANDYGIYDDFKIIFYIVNSIIWAVLSLFASVYGQKKSKTTLIPYEKKAFHEFRSGDITNGNVKPLLDLFIF